MLATRYIQYKISEEEMEKKMVYVNLGGKKCIKYWLSLWFKILKICEEKVFWLLKEISDFWLFWGYVQLWYLSWKGKCWGFFKFPLISTEFPGLRFSIKIFQKYKFFPVILRFLKINPVAGLFRVKCCFVAGNFLKMFQKSAVLTILQ